MVASSIQLGTSVLPGTAQSFCNVGINMYNFAPAPAAFTYQVYGTNGNTLQTFCNYPTSAAALVGDCDTQFSYPPSRRFCSCRSLSACNEVIEIPIPEPTFAPTIVPSRAPTYTVPYRDCTSNCCFFNNGASANVASNTLISAVSLSNYFTLSFDYINPTINAYPTMGNILDLQDPTTGHSLLYVSLPWSINTVLGYDGVLLDRGGPTINSDALTRYTTVYVSVQPGTISISTSSNPSWVSTINIANVNTTDKQYYLFLSNPNVGLNRVSSGGTIKNVCVKNNVKTPPKLRFPVTDCRESCSMLTTGSCLDVSFNQTNAIVELSTNFKMQFDYFNPTIHGTDIYSNILDLVDVSTGASLLSMSTPPWTTAMAVGYNGNLIDSWGPMLVWDYQVTYTTLNIEVTDGYVTVTSSSNPYWHDAIAIPANVNTTSRLYYLMLSNGDTSPNRESSLGCIKNIFITGTCIRDICSSFAYSVSIEFSLIVLLPVMCASQVPTAAPDLLWPLREPPPPSPPAPPEAPRARPPPQPCPTVA
jgi:hypothetical protein